jgi:hypothetical protein
MQLFIVSIEDLLYKLVQLGHELPKGRDIE